MRLPCHCPRRWAGQRCPRPAAAARSGGAVLPSAGAEQGPAALSPPGRWGGPRAGRAERVSPGGAEGRPRGGPHGVLPPAGARERGIRRATGTQGWKKRRLVWGWGWCSSLQRCWWFLVGSPSDAEPWFQAQVFFCAETAPWKMIHRKRVALAPGVCEEKGAPFPCPIWGTPRGFLGPVLLRRHPRPGFLRRHQCTKLAVEFSIANSVKKER